MADRPAGDAQLEPLLARLADTIRANYLRVDDPDQRLSEEEARQLAAEVLRRLRAPELFPRLLYRRGILFAVEEGAAGGRDVLHVLLWNGERWVGVDALELPPAGPSG